MGGHRSGQTGGLKQLASEFFACDHWEPEDGFGDELRHALKTLAIALAIVGTLTLAAWRVRAHVDRSRAEDAARRQPPTVEVSPIPAASLSDSSTLASYRWRQ